MNRIKEFIKKYPDMWIRKKNKIIGNNIKIYIK